MSNIEDGGPAFPVTFEGGKNNGESPFFAQGMSLRDHFACHALVTGYVQHDGSPDKIAEWAYQIADAMLYERSKP